MEKKGVTSHLATSHPELDLKPLIMHALQKLCGDRISRSRTDEGIYPAFWTKSGLVSVDPLDDVGRGEDR
jgi:hypothetical protein